MSAEKLLRSQKAVGHLRYDTEEELSVVDELYEQSGLPKKYDKAQTACGRVLASPDVSAQDKQTLKTQYARLNSGRLKRQTTSLQQKLIRLNAMKKTSTKKNVA